MLTIQVDALKKEISSEHPSQSHQTGIPLGISRTGTANALTSPAKIHYIKNF